MSRWVYHSETEFRAHHALTLYQGEPEKKHEHLWKVAIEVGAHALKPEYFALDFHAVHEVLQSTVAPLHEIDLNIDERIGVPSPTAERLAEVVALDLTGRIRALGGELLKVSVWEGPENRVDLML